MAIDEAGTDVSGAHFTADRGVIRSRDALVPIMMTTDLGIARSDCLFYLVRAR